MAKPAGKPAAKPAPGKKPVKKFGGVGAGSGVGGKPAEGKKRPANGAAAAAGAKHHKKPRTDGHAASKSGSETPSSEKTSLSKHEKKEKIRQKKVALKKNFGIIQDAVPIWEVLRQHHTPNEEKARLVDQILHKVQGKLLELARHHTASRILQFCVMYGTDAQKRLLLDQIKADFLLLSKSKHGRHLVQKLINQAKKEEVPGLVALCKGHVKELLRHPQGADVMIDLYDVASTQLRNAICAEFYGREFSLFDGIAAKGSSLTSLAQLLEGCDAAKRRAVMLHMTKALMPIVEKGILHPPMVHRLLKDFFDCAPSASVEDVIDTLSTSGTTVLKMVHTHEGAAVGCMLLAYGSAKDRKRLIKAMKGHVQTMATNEWGYSVLCTALTVVDDTSLVSKVVIAELKAMLEDAIEDPHASRVLLQLLCPNSRRYLPPAVLSMLHPPQRTVVGTSGNMVTDIEGDEDELSGGHSLGSADAGQDDDDDDDFLQLKSKGGQQSKGKGKAGKGKGDPQGPQGKAKKGEEDDDDEEGKGEAQPPGGKRVLGLSKKDELLRRKELLGPANSSSSLASALTSACAARAGAYLRTPMAADVVVEVARGGAQSLLAELVPEGMAAVHAAIVAEASPDTGSQGSAGWAEDSEEAEQEGGGLQGPAGPQGEHVCTHYYASRAIRRLLLAGSESGPGGKCARQLAQELWQGALKGQCQRWIGTHAEKVLAALLHCGCEGVAKEAAAELSPLLPAGETLEAWSERLVHTALVKEKQAGGTKGGQKGKQQKQQKGQQQEQLPQTPGTQAGKQKGGAAVTPMPKASGQQQQTPAGAGGLSTKKRKLKVEATPQSKAGADQVKETGVMAHGKSTAKKKKRPSSSDGS